MNTHTKPGKYLSRYKFVNFIQVWKNPKSCKYFGSWCKKKKNAELVSVRTMLVMLAIINSQMFSEPHYVSMHHSTAILNLYLPGSWNFSTKSCYHMIMIRNNLRILNIWGTHVCDSAINQAPCTSIMIQNHSTIIHI